MDRRASRSKEGVNRGAWSVDEDRILYDYITTHGEGKWGVLPRSAGLRRCGKSCRLQWLNYLRPGIKSGNFSEDEEDLINRLHKLLGNRWSLIAGRLPGRTDNAIKNYWNTKLRKKVKEHNDEPQETESPSTKQSSVNASLGTSNSHPMIRTKAKKFTKVSTLPDQKLAQITKENNPRGAEAEEGVPQPSLEDQDPWNYFMDLDGGEILQSNSQDSDYMSSFDETMLENGAVVRSGAWPSSSHSSPFKEDTFESWGITQLLALDVLDSQ